MSKLLRLLLLAAGAVVFVAIVRRIGAATLVDLLRQVGWAFVVISSIYAVHIAVRAVALWRCLASRQDGEGIEAVCRVALVDVLKIRFAAEGVEMLTFTGPFLAEPAKAWLISREGLGAAEAFGGVAIEYLLYTMVSAWMAAASLLLLLQQHALSEGLRAPIEGVLAGIAAITAGFFFAAIAGRGLIVPLARLPLRLLVRRRADAIIERTASVERVLLDFIHHRPARLATVLVIEAVGHALLASEVWVVMRALGEATTVLGAIAFEGGVKFISVVFFFVPGQVGAQEGVYALLARAIGETAAAGLTLALVRRIRALIVGGIGVAALATMRARPRRQAA